MELEERVTELERRVKELERRDLPTLWPLFTPEPPIGFPGSPHGPMSTGDPMPWRGNTWLGTILIAGSIS